MGHIAIATILVQLVIKIIELRLKHYEANPDLLEQDAENAELLGRWGQALLGVITKLLEELGVDFDIEPLPSPPEDQ